MRKRQERAPGAAWDTDGSARPPAPDGEPSDGGTPGGGAPVGVAFLLAQLGAHGAARFADRLGELRLGPAHAGVLRLVAAEPDLNQRALAARLHAMPSRVVALVDELEARGLLTRRRREADRRSHALQLTDAGRDTLASLRRIATAHEAEITAALTPDERERLAGLLRRLVDANGLTPGVHPGYHRDPEVRP